MAALLAFDEFVRSQRHSLPQARDQEGISHGEKRQVLAERQILRVQEDDGLIRECREPGVDMRDGVGDAACQLVGLRRLKGDLDKNNLRGI